MNDNKNCTNCKAKLERGFFYITHSEDASSFSYTVWVKGEKEDLTKFMGPHETAPQYPVRIYKCSECGHIEFYAESAEPWRY